MYLKTLISFEILNLIIIVIALPLIFRFVPPNYWYGFRINATIRNKKIWYLINEFFGWGMTISSIISMVIILFLFNYQYIPPIIYMNINIAMVLIPQTITLLLTISYLNHVLEKEKDNMNKKENGIN
jgi:hypothetical protein